MEQEHLPTDLQSESTQQALFNEDTHSPIEELQASTEDDAPTEEKTSVLYDIYALLHDLVYILAAITLVFVFCVRLVGVNGESMLPTLHHKDYLALESNVIMGDLEYGDVVVARELTFEDGEPIVKRVIATEGQSVLIRMEEDGYAHVYVDGVMLDEPYILESMHPYYFEQDDDGDPTQFSTIVSPGHIFVMGDNRNNSSDSRVRSIGEIKLDQVMGKVLMIIFPGKEEFGERDWSRVGRVS